MLANDSRAKRVLRSHPPPRGSGRAHGRVSQVQRDH